MLGLELGTGHGFCLCRLHLAQFDPSLRVLEVSLTQHCHSSCVFSDQSSWKQRGPMGLQFPTRRKSQASPTTGGLVTECTLRHPWPTVSRAGFLLQCPARSPQACDTFRIHQRVFAHPLCARRTCECAKIQPLRSLHSSEGGGVGRQTRNLVKYIEC